MKHLVLALCVALALVMEVPTRAVAHPQASPRPSLAATTMAPAPLSSRIDARRLLAGAALEQHGHGARGSAARARGGTAVGPAVPRSSARFSRRFVGRPFFFSPFAFGGFGLGFAYDPFFWGYPYGWGYPYWGYPYGAYGYPYGAYGYGYGYDGYSGRGYDRYGSLKLDVKPQSAEVYVDGYYMGQVRDFDGTFHHLDLRDGDHKIEIRANGYEPVTLNMRIMPGRTVTYRGDLRRGAPSGDDDRR